MLVKNRYSGKTKEEAINNAKIALQEMEENLYIKEIEVKTGLFNKKTEIEVVRRDDVVEYMKEYLKELIHNMGLTCNLEVKKRENRVNITVISDNNSILIGKNGRTLESINLLLKQKIHNEIGEYFPFVLDIGEYKIAKEQKLESLAKRIAREVANTKIEAKLDPMNSYERRIIHEALVNNKKVTTESEGEEPNRYVVIKPKEEAKFQVETGIFNKKV